MNKIIVTENLELIPKYDDDVVIRHQEIKTETSSLNTSAKFFDDEIAYPILSRSQNRWLSIGEIIGAWIVRNKTKP